MQLLEWKLEDIEKWMIDVLKGQINHCKLECQKEWIPILFKRVSQIPTNDDELFELIKSQPDYLTQKQKEAKEKAKRESTFKVE